MKQTWVTKANHVSTLMGDGLVMGLFSDSTQIRQFTKTMLLRKVTRQQKNPQLATLFASCETAASL